MDLYKKWQMAPNSIREAIAQLCNAIGIDFEKDFLSNYKVPERTSQWISLREAAAYANVSTFTVRRWCYAQKVVSRKLNPARCGRILISRDSLAVFIDSCKTDGRAA